MTAVLTIAAPIPPDERDHALLLLAAQDDDESRCDECELPTDPDGLVELFAGGLCVPCVRALLGDDVYGPEHGRDI